MERTRAGFTLVELLVVVVIIGMLVGLLVPAVISARERARQGLCVNRLKELGTATIHYESIRGQFPGWRNQAPLGNAAVSWAVTLFPYLGREDLWRDWRTGSGPAIYFEQLVCPSDSANSGPYALNYVANTGLVGRDINDQLAIENNQLGRHDPRWGIFHDRLMPNPTSVTLDYLNQYDGASTTFLISERLDAAGWNYIDNDGFARLIGYPATIGFTWWGEEWNTCPGDYCNGPPEGGVRFHISSNHSGGTNVCFADGHIRQLSDTMSYIVYQALMTPNGRERNVEGGISSQDY